jgi:hypothetical protein
VDGGFIDDQKPSLIFIVAYYPQQLVNKLIIIKIKKEEERPLTQVLAELEVKKSLHEMALKKMKDGQAKEPKRYFDNYGVKVDKKDEQSRFQHHRVSTESAPVSKDYHRS